MTFGSLFSGIGGLDLGLERAGMECRFQVENDEFCNRVLAKHWPTVARYGDIRRVAGDELERVDLICGGFPCPPVSVAGKRKGTADERWIWPEFARIVRMVRPRFVLVENVPGLLSANGGGAMAEVLGDLAGLGYDARWYCLRASDFGASHRRARVFIVAYQQNNNGWRGIDGAEARVGPGGIGGRGSASGDGDVADAQRHNRGGEINNPEIKKKNAARSAGWPSRRSDSLADPSDRLLPQPGPGPQGRDGAGPAGAAVGDSGGAGLEVRGCERADVARERPPAERAGAALADAASGRNERQHQHSGVLRVVNESSSSLPAFAPGPADPRWPDLLVRHPELRPALSQAEAESIFRRVADGPPNRTYRLRALGNAVVPACAEWIGRQINGTH